MELSVEAGVGAAGVPVKAGELRGAAAAQLGAFAPFDCRKYPDVPTANCAVVPTFDW